MYDGLTGIQKKGLAVFVVMVLLITTYGVGYVSGWSSINSWADQKTYIGPGSLVSGAAYVIFIDDSNAICAKNGVNGKVDYRSSNATYVIQSAFDASGGGTIYFDAGTYEVYNLTISNKAQKIVGASQTETYIKQMAGANTNVFELAYAEQFFYFSDICILGDRDANDHGSGIVADYDQIVTIERCYIVDFPEYGISVSRMNQFTVTDCSIISNVQGGIWLKRCHQATIENSIVELNGNSSSTTSFGICIDDYGSAGSSDGAIISGCWFESQSDKVQENHVFVNATGGNAVTISECRSNSNFVGNTSVNLQSGATGNTISNCWFSNNAEDTPSVYIAPLCKRNVLLFNVYSGDPGYMDRGNDTTILDNYEGQDNYYKLAGIIAVSSGEPQTINSSSMILLNGYSVIPLMVNGGSNITLGVDCIQNATYNTIVILLNIRSPSITLVDKTASGTDTNLLLGAATRTLGGYGGSITLMYSQYLGDWVEIGYSGHL